MFKYAMPVLIRYGAILTQFVVMALIANKLSLEDAGAYFMIFGALSTHFVAGLGLPDGAVKTIPPLYDQGRSDAAVQRLREVLGVGWTISTISSIFFAAGVYVFTKSELISLLSGTWWLSYAVVFCCSQVLVASGDVKKGTFFFYSSINIVVLLVSFCVLWPHQSASLSTALAACSGGAALAASMVAFVVVRKIGRPALFEFRAVMPSFRSGLPIAAGRVVQAAIIWSPVWAAGIFLGKQDAAIVGLSLRLVSSVGAVLAAVRFSVRPELARHAAAGRWKSIELDGSRIALWTTGLACVALVGDLFVGNFVIGKIFGADYSGAALIVAFALFGTIGESIGGPVDEILKMSGRANFVFLGQVSALLIGIPIQIVGSYFAGSIGLVFGFSFCFAGLYVILIFYLWRDKGILVLPRLNYKTASK